MESVRRAARAAAPLRNADDLRRGAVVRDLLQNSKLPFLVESRAKLIRNPVKKLRYLRAATGTLPPARSARNRTLVAAGAAGLGSILLLVVALKYVGGSGLEAKAVDRATLPSKAAPAAELNAAAPATNEAPLRVWLVESKRDHEIYSNGLRIETAGTVRNTEREWTRLDLKTGEVQYGGGPPAGIVFHSTESHIVPFEESKNARLRLAAEGVLEYVRRNRSYHYLIDRFGRVHRVVADSDAAFHAGISAWGNGESAWLGLNQSFLGVSLEAATAGENGDRNPITPAQIYALRNLTMMLRSQYSIPSSNCITHAQVSLNASTRLLGHHTDWASGFPFAAIGLPDNYSLQLTSMTAFGFGYDSDFLSAGAAAWTGLALSEKQVRQQAAAAQLTLPVYRAQLNEQYRNAIARAARDKENIP